MTVDVSDPKLRRSGIGGSDAAAAVGLNPYRTPLELFLEKTGQVDSFEGNERTHWGNILEGPVADEYARRTDQKVARVNKTLRNEAYSHAFAHVDRRVLNCDPSKGLEVKTGGFFTRKDWGDEGTDQVPMHYLLQVQHMIAVTGWPSFDVAVLLNTSEYRQYEIARNDRLIDGLMAKEAEFWQRVVTNNPPPPQTVADCDLRWAEALDDVVYADDQVRDAVFRIAELKAEIKARSDELDKHVFDVKSFMQNKAVLMHGKERLVTWNGSKRFNEAKFKAQHPQLWKQHAEPRLDKKALEKAERKLYASFKETAGSRTFFVKYKPKKKEEAQ